MRSALSVLAAALVVAAATGCSSDDSETAVTTTTVVTTTTAPVETRPEPPEDQSRWAREVDQACTPWQDKVAEVTPPADAGDLERYLSETLPLIRKQVAAVDAVKLPANAGDARQARLFVASLHALERGLSRYVAAMRAGDVAATQQALADANAAGLKARAYVAPLGVTQCGGYEGG